MKFFTRTRKNLAQDPSVLPVHEDLVYGEKKPLDNGLEKTIAEIVLGEGNLF
ncbi:MAG: hypothetical protein LBT70_02765 [Holosporaceae bacterium]|nr:hypothetical protein [Holosporaceae bacterium]